MQSKWNTSQFLLRMQSVYPPNLDNRLAISLKLNIHLLYNPAILLLNIYPSKKKLGSHKKQYINVHSRFVYNHQKLETAKSPSTEEYINKNYYFSMLNSAIYEFTTRVPKSGVWRSYLILNGDLSCTLLF